MVDYVVSKSNFYSWKPNIFINKDYGNLVKHSLEDDFYLPVNVESIINKGYSLKKLNLEKNKIDLLLEKNKNEKFNISYTTEEKDLKYFNDILPRLIESQLDSEFMLRCQNCSVINVIRAVNKKILTITCKSCKYTIYPMKYVE